MKSLRIAAAALTLGLLAAPSVAQTPRGTVGEEIEVTEVLLDVVVTDRHGNVVLGLGPDDFIVEENGQRVQLNDVAFYSHRRFLESTARAEDLRIDPSAVPVERQFILFFHDQRLDFPRLIAQQLEAGRRARQWVDTELETTDWVAVVAYDTALKIHQDFTNDREALDRAIRRAVQGLDPDHQAAIRQPAGAPSMLAHLRGSPARVYDAVEAVADAVDPIRGRKNLALFSIGFGNVNSFGFYSPDTRFYPDMVRALNDANVAVYAIDLIPSPAFRFNALSNSLSMLSADTGGQSYFNFVNFATPLEQMAADTNGYYLLSYTAEHVREEGFQNVEVDTRNPEFRVRAREGYLIGDEARGAAGG